MAVGLKSWLALAALGALWGTSFLFIDLSLHSFSPLGIVAVRVFFGAVVLGTCLALKKWRLPANYKAWLLFLSFGITGNLLPFYLISLGQQSVNSGIAGLLMAIMPLCTMMLAHYFVPGERLNPFKILGFLTGLCGVALVLSPTLQMSGNQLTGCLLILTAAFSYAVNSIVVRCAPVFHPMVAGTGMLLVATLVIGPVWLIQEQPWQANYEWRSWLAVIWLGIGPTGLATLLYFQVIAGAGPTFLSNVNYLVPVVAYFSGVWLLGEALHSYALLALLIILFGIKLTRKKPIARLANSL